MARKEYGCEMIASRIKILISFLLIIAITVMKHVYLPIAMALLCIVFAAKLKVIRDYSKKLIFPLALSLFIFITQCFTYGVNAINLGIFSVYSEGIKYGFLIFSRVFASSSILLLLVITTSESELLESMSYFGVPKTMIEISLFMARYIQTFSSEGKKLKLAQESRCSLSKNTEFKKKMQNLTSIAGVLINRAFERSEEVYIAMLSRGWKPELRYSMETRPLNKRDLILGIILSSGIFLLLGLDRLVW
jgi:cobalt/nickel transport system permease protein